MADQADTTIERPRIGGAQLRAVVQALAGELQALGVSSLSIYGSYARGDANPSSDLDVFVDYDRSSRFSLVTLARIKQMLEDVTGVRVDITTLNSIPEKSRAEISDYALKVF